MKYKTEFHVHTRGSKDSTLNFIFLFMQCKIKKINCIAITDHNEVNWAVKHKEKFEKNNIKVIVGEEIFTSEGEIIGLFLKKRILPNLTPLETINEIKRQNGIVYIPHPYEPYRHKTVLKEKNIEKYSNMYDLIEFHNGRNRTEEISNKQKKLQNKYGITGVIGSDAHTFFEIGRNYMMLDSIDKKNIVNSIKNCDEYKCSKCILFAHKWTKVARAIKMIEKGKINELFRIIYRKFKKREPKTL